MDQTSKQFRILAVSLSSRGFGYAVMEGDKRLVVCGKKIFDNDKNIRSLAHLEKMITRNQPDVMALHDVNAKGSFRATRIKQLHRKVFALARQRKIRVVTVSAKELRGMILGNQKGTKHEMAQAIANQFSDELASRLPPKRKDWTSEDSRMDIFDAVGLALHATIKKP